MRKLSILMFTPYYPPHVGGVEFYAQKLTEKLIASGHQVTVITADIPHSLEAKTTNVLVYPATEIVHNFPLPQFWKKSFWSTYGQIKKSDYDIVIGHTRFFLSSLWAALYAQKRHIPYVHIEHGSSFVVSGNKLIQLAAWLYDHSIGRYTLSKANATVVISKSVADFIQNLYPVKNLSVIYRGIDSVNTVKDSTLSLDTSLPIITFVGRLVTSKGIFELVTALSKIKNNSWHCYVAGEGENKKELISFVTKLDLGSRITFLGSLDTPSIMTLLNKTALFVHPSYTEGLPTAVLEAALAGVPIIATDVGGTKEVSEIIHLVPPKNNSLLSLKIKEILENLSVEKEKSQRMIAQIKAKFLWENTLEEFEKVFALVSSQKET